jgi:hypothetical protein
MTSAEAATELAGHFHEFLGKVQARVERARRAASGSYGPGEKVVKLSDVVKDTPLPTFAIDLSFLTKLLAARRKLRPQRTERTVQATQVCVNPTQCVFTLLRCVLTLLWCVLTLLSVCSPYSGVC